MQPGSCVAVDIVDKKNLPAGNYGNCKTSPVTGKPAVKSAKVSRQGTKRNVTVTFTVPKSCDGTDWVLPINLLYSNLV